jgi:hypothetical protein
MKSETIIPFEKVNTNRRTFVKLAAVTAGTIAVTGVSASSPPSGPESPAGEKPSDKGYRITPHIQSYYDKARF